MIESSDMFSIKVERLINKPVVDVFNFLADHENYCNFPGVDKSELLEQGQHEKNGLGALRRVSLGPIKLEERITAFEKPNKLHYQIEKSSPLPFLHDRGEIQLLEEGSQTRVIWLSDGHIDIPIFGNLIFDKMINKQGAAGFIKVLEWIDKQQ
jgi:carbon monoxide dehydrogenase subunit G